MRGNIREEIRRGVSDSRERLAGKLHQTAAAGRIDHRGLREVMRRWKDRGGAASPRPCGGAPGARRTESDQHHVQLLEERYCHDIGACSKLLLEPAVGRCIRPSQEHPWVRIDVRRSLDLVPVKSIRGNVVIRAKQSSGCKSRRASRKQRKGNAS